MNRAGSEAYAVMRRNWPKARRPVVFCGSGNNGGDGYVVASLAARDGLPVIAVAIGEPRSQEASRARDEAVACGVIVVDTADDGLAKCDLIIDGILGTGLSRAPEGTAATAIVSINACGAPVFSLDIPSGLDADGGHVPGVVVQADATSTFIGMKIGLLTGLGPEVAGTLYFHDLGVPAAIYREIPPLAERIVAERVRRWLPHRRRCAHKGLHGHVVVVGGNRGMSGALRIASEAAARCGAGLVTALTRAEHSGMINIGRPEIMVSGVTDADALDGLLEGRDALAIGPGLGRDEWARSLFDRALTCNLPRVIDADALNLLAGSGCRDAGWILTPHPGEAARLLDCGVDDIASNRIEAARAIVTRHGGVCVLKGCGTIVAGKSAVFVCDRGNPGMAGGGMGDCLTGMLAALLGQGLEPLQAAVCGVWLHARAADREAVANGAVGMLATDLFPWIRLLREDPVD